MYAVIPVEEIIKKLEKVEKGLHRDIRDLAAVEAHEWPKYHDAVVMMFADVLADLQDVTAALRTQKRS